MEIKVIDIIRGTTVDGPGLRTSVYLAGCNHLCDGCHNPQSWNPDNGQSMSVEQIIEIIKEEDFNVTISGGDPLYNPNVAISLCREIKKYGYNIWLYTGFAWETIISNPAFRPIVEIVDVIVDGKYQKELRDIGLRFKGSANQRIINVKESIKSGEIVIWHD